jgi:hypothetical protein
MVFGSIFCQNSSCNSEKSLTLILAFFFKLGTHIGGLALLTTGIDHLQLMESIEKPQMDKYKNIMNDWNYNASCVLTSLLVWEYQVLDFCCTDCTHIYIFHFQIQF